MASTRLPRPGVTEGPPSTADARAQRQRRHREMVRSEIVDGAFRAVDRLGPQVSLQEIAAEAGTGKPRIYRHFTDKADLFHAIAGRLRDMLLSAILPNVDFAAAPVREVLGRSVDEYVSLVERHPNVLRLVLQGGFGGADRRAGGGLAEGRQITTAIAEMFNHELRGMKVEPAVLELAAASAFGSAAAATEWWLGPDPGSPRRMLRGEFAAHLTTIMLGGVSGTAELVGVVLDPDRPIGAAVPRVAVGQV